MWVYYYKFYNELILISLNNVNLFDIITINFIINLSFIKNSYINKINNFILILINKLTKYISYIVIIKNLNVKKFVNIMWKEFISLRNIMRNLIIN